MRVVGVAGPTASPLGEQNQGSPQLRRQPVEPILLLVIHRALGAG